LLAAPREPVAGTQRAYLKAWELGLNAPRAPADFAVERDGRRLDPGAVVLAHEGAPAAEVEALRAGRRVEEVGHGQGHAAALGEPVEVVVGGGMEPAEERQDLVADQAALRVPVRGVFAEREILGAAVGVGVFAPHAEERTDDAVLTPPLDPARAGARDDAVEDGLD